MSLTQWMKRVGEKEMPAFRRTASEVMEATRDPTFGADALGQLILKDPALTARVLRVANAAAYNPTGRRILTVSKAILVLGVDTIRNICLGLSLVESLLRGRREDRVMADLGRSIHAAFLARALASAQREPASEEVFIAALLQRMGHMVFWCFSEDEGVALDAILRPGMDESTAAKAVLGFGLDQLTMALVEDWKLSNLLVEILKGRREGVAIESVQHAWRWCQCLDAGWNSPRALSMAARIADWLRMDPVSTFQLLSRVARQARETAQLFGSRTCVDSIPLPPEVETVDPDAFDPDRPASSLPGTGGEESPDSQLECLKKLARISVQGGSLQEVLATLVHGVQDGLGMERTVFCLLGAGDQVEGRLGGEGTPEEFVQGFRFTLRRQMADSLSRALEQGGVVVNALEPGQRAAILPEPLAATLRGVPFLFGTLQVGNRTIGAVYCDRALSGRSLVASVLDGFRHLVQQANITLNQLAAARPASREG